MPSTAYNKDDLVEDESHQTISSYFMGPKAENYEWFKKTLIEILEAQRDTRLDYFPRDKKVITEDIQMSTAFRKSTKKMTNAIREAARLMGLHSIPFWSPRYQGHMCMDLSMPSLLGYFMTMLYNPNNVTIEASPITTIAELQVGIDLCHMFGYNTDPKAENPDGTPKPIAWGHITCGGTVANLESVWVSRNLKYYPLSIRSAMKEKGPLHFIHDKFKIKTCKGEEKLLSELTTWEMLNLQAKEVLDIPERLYREYYISPGFLNDVMKQYGIQSTSKRTLDDEFNVKNGRLFCSNTKHYSWPKSGAIVGIGSENVIGIHVDRGARVDLEDLRKQLQYCLDNEICVFMVVAIIGSTEEGAVDPLSRILKMRKDFQKEGLSFLVHGDGAWGGYFCTMLPTIYKPGEEIALPSEGGAHEGFVPDASLKTQTAEDLFMLREADSVTVDPHKAAYIPYPAGGLCYRDGRLRYLVTWTSPYISRGETTETSIGVFGVEGSKPGASVMSTWLSNACIGLGPDGYGKLLGEVTFTCSRLAAEWAAMTVEKDPYLILPLNELPSELKEGATKESVDAERKRIREQILEKSNLEIYTEDEGRKHEDKAMKLLRDIGSDLNINAFSANWRYENGDLNDDVEEANYFNQLVIQDISIDSPEDEPTKIPFYLTSTTFMIHEYGECAQHFKKRLGLVQDDTDLVVMRNVVMSPWPTDGMFTNNLVNEYRKVMDKHLVTCRKRNDMTPEKHEFLLQGTDRIYAVHFPMFNLAKHRRQLIYEVALSDDAKKTYLEEKKSDPEGMFMLASNDPISLTDLIEKQVGFTGEISKRLHKRADPKPGEPIYAYRSLVKNVNADVLRIIKAKSLKSRYRDRNYPANFVPFYLYGSKNSLNIDHVLVRSPNISLSADNVTLSKELLDKIGDDVLERGCLLTFNDLSEAAMQPFQSTEGDLQDTMNADSQFFFTPGSKFSVNVFEDHVDAMENGPGLVDIYGEHEHSSASGQATHGHGVDAIVSRTGVSAKAEPGITAAAETKLGAGTDESAPTPAVNGAANGVHATTDPAKWKFKLVGSGELTLNKGRYVDSMHINMDPFYKPEGSEKAKKWKAVFDRIGKELD